MLSIEEVMEEMRLYAEDDHYDPDVGGWLMALEAAMREKEAKIQRLTERVASAGVQGFVLAGELRKRDAKIEVLAEENCHLRGALHDHEQMVNERDADVERLNYRLSTLEEDRLERDAKIEQLRKALHLMLEIAPRGLLNAKEEVALKAAYAALAGKEDKP